MVEAVITGTDYILFVAPFVMGLGGLMIYFIGYLMTRPRPRTPGE